MSICKFSLWILYIELDSGVVNGFAIWNGCFSTPCCRCQANFCSSCLYILYVWVHTRDIEISWFHISGKNNTSALGDGTSWFCDPPQYDSGICVCVFAFISVYGLGWGEHKCCWQDTDWCLCSAALILLLVLYYSSPFLRLWEQDKYYGGGHRKESDPSPCLLSNWRGIGSQGNRSLKLKVGSIIIKGLIMSYFSNRTSCRISSCKGKPPKSWYRSVTWLSWCDHHPGVS